MYGRDHTESTLLGAKHLNSTIFMQKDFQCLVKHLVH